MLVCAEIEDKLIYFAHQHNVSVITMIHVSVLWLAVILHLIPCVTFEAAVTISGFIKGHFQ